MKSVILLTSTVSPVGIPYSGTVEERKNEYLQAIKFYLSETTYNIVIIDNSGYNFCYDINTTKRFEALFFNCDRNDIEKGKGYSEANLIKYGIENSRFLKSADYIIKITGRHIIYNITQLLRYCNNSKSAYVDTDIYLNFAHSYFFYAPINFYTEYLFKHIKDMNDSKGYYFEHALGLSLKEWRREYTHEQFLFPIYIKGHPGTSAKKYSKPNCWRYCMIFCKYLIYKFFNYKKKFFLFR